MTDANLAPPSFPAPDHDGDEDEILWCIVEKCDRPTEPGHDTCAVHAAERAATVRSRDQLCTVMTGVSAVGLALSLAFIGLLLFGHLGFFSGFFGIIGFVLIEVLSPLLALAAAIAAKSSRPRTLALCVLGLHLLPWGAALAAQWHLY